MKRMALSSSEEEIIRGLRVERNIYNQALADAVVAAKEQGSVGSDVELICKAILALRKE